VESAVHKPPSDAALSPVSNGYSVSSQPVSRSRRTADEWRRYSQHLVSTPFFDFSIRQTASEAKIARPSLVSFHSPYYLNCDSWDDTAAFYNDEFDQEQHFYAAMERRRQHPALHSVDLGSTTTWRLQESFVVNFLNWYPLMEPKDFVRHVDSARMTAFTERKPSTALALLGFAVGALIVASKSFEDYGDSNYDLMPGLEYLVLGMDMLETLSKGNRSNLLVLQGRVLVV
jgi:hypothetical protein